MTTEVAVTQPPARHVLPRSVRLVAVVVCLGGSFAASVCLMPTSKKPSEHAQEEAHPEAPEALDRSIDRLIRNEQFEEALAACQSADTPPAEPWLRYRVAVCLEHLEQWTEAAEQYESITQKAPADLWANATLGVARCRLAHGDLAEADAAIQEVERLGGSVRSPASHERTRLRACVEYSRLGTPRTADPFDPMALAWPTAVDRRSGEPIWLPTPPAPTAPHDSHKDHHATEPISVPAPAPAVPAEASRTRVRESLEKVLEHDEHPAVRLTLANFDAQDRAWDKAMPVYRQLIEDDPESAEAKLASYNLGLGLLKDGQTAAAREAFLGTLDRDPHGPWGELARYWVGRTYLDGGDPTTALRSLGEASAAKSRKVRAAADRARVACHLLRKDDTATEQESHELRPESSPNAMALTELFENLARYRTTPSELRAEQVAESLHHAHDLRDLGPGGVFLAGRLYEEIGETSQMAKLYDDAAPDYRGPWAVQMTLAAAEHWDSKDRRAEARSRYRAVAAVDSGAYGRRAEQKLAALALRDGNGRECLTRCLRLWKQRPDEPEQLLQLMGRGYELTGQYAAAAACYAGREPKLD
ncbi:tetratricopeptide repeat protein [Limnoglobus roseus]|uniref:Uncharacterized protein n=1 Tax=Limnoglobus roseus TaxID=2598579 RepID=A0A5C1A601_9BACT|nr:tetratricopeptide repeat protein [Limnoglobus roseus]QEL13785.1 hypothetical protein PX52LOC_00643 [Limnoglobus roseus]